MTTNPPPSEDGPQTKPFAMFLQEQPDGVHSEASEKLQDLVNAVRQEGRAGTLTLTVQVKPQKRTVQVTTNVKVSAPQPVSDPAVWFVDKAGNLTRRDPDQPELPGIRQVPPMPIPVNVDPATGEVKEPVNA